MPAFGAGWIEQITVRSGLKLNLNGQEVVPTDASGKEMPVFLYDQTTYVPVRFLSQQYGKDVAWDSENATVYISDPVQNETDDSESLPEGEIPGSGKALDTLYSQASFNNASVESRSSASRGPLYNTLCFYGRNGSSATFPLNKEYSSISFSTYNEAGMFPFTVTAVKDGSSINLYSGVVGSKKFTFDVQGCESITFAASPKGFAIPMIYKGMLTRA